MVDMQRHRVRAAKRAVDRPAAQLTDPAVPIGYRLADTVIRAAAGVRTDGRGASDRAPVDDTGAQPHADTR